MNFNSFVLTMVITCCVLGFIQSSMFLWICVVRLVVTFGWASIAGGLVYVVRLGWYDNDSVVDCNGDTWIVF